MNSSGRREYPSSSAKRTIPEVVGLSFREVRPALVALVNSGQIRFGRTISSQYFTLPHL
nr:MAG TPA: dissimilatory sulfite reductase D [Caudoviricetes sp.]